MSGLVSDEDIRKAGDQLSSRLGAAFVVVARVSQVGDTYFISAKMIDVRTGEITAQASDESGGQDRDHAEDRTERRAQAGLGRPGGREGARIVSGGEAGREAAAHGTRGGAGRGAGTAPFPDLGLLLPAAVLRGMGGRHRPRRGLELRLRFQRAVAALPGAAALPFRVAHLHDAECDRRGHDVDVVRTALRRPGRGGLGIPDRQDDAADRGGARRRTRTSPWGISGPSRAIPTAATASAWTSASTGSS